jgi:hypothetical protein
LLEFIAQRGNALGRLRSKSSKYFQQAPMIFGDDAITDIRIYGS